MKYHQKANLLPTISIALVVIAMIFFAANAFADTGRTGNVNGDAVVDERTDEQANEDEGTGNDQDQTTTDDEAKPDEQQQNDESVDEQEVNEETIGDETADGSADEDKEPWYRKYWWVLICPAALIFFGAGVGIYYLVSWIRGRKK